MQIYIPLCQKFLTKGEIEMSEQISPLDEADADGATEHAVIFDGPLPGDRQARMPASFRPASWRGTLPVDEATGRVGLSLDLEDGETVRVGLDLGSALDVVATLAEALSAHQRRRSQRDRSPGTPSRDVSTPEDGVKV